MLSPHAGVKSMRRPTRSWRSVQIEQHGFVSSSCSDNLRGLKPLFSLGCSKLLCQLFHFTVSGYCSTVKKATRKYENKMVWLLHETFSNSASFQWGEELKSGLHSVSLKTTEKSYVMRNPCCPKMVVTFWWIKKWAWRADKVAKLFEHTWKLGLTSHLRLAFLSLCNVLLSHTSLWWGLWGSLGQHGHQQHRICPALCSKRDITCKKS